MKKTQTFTLTPNQIKLFETQDFENRVPGTVVQDFESLLAQIGDQGMPVTPSHLITMHCLEMINRQLARPLELRLKRAMQKSYPHINGLYLLLRATGIGLIDTKSKQPLLKIDPFVLASWHSLNGAERYFELLKSWWGRATEEIIGERRGLGTEVLSKNLLFIERFPKTGILIAETPQDQDSLRYYPGFYNLALMELFGLLEVQTTPPTDGQGWLPASIRMTDWGIALLSSYADFITQSLVPQTELTHLMPGFSPLSDPLECFERWSQVVRPMIRAWRKGLEIPETSFQPGPHVFKVTLGGRCWRRIAIQGDAYLDELASVILDAFDFDHDHLYCFYYQDRFGRTTEIDHSYMANDTANELTDAVRIGDIPLVTGMRLVFLFDFGDQWEFTIHTENVNADFAIKSPQVLETLGKAPEQYGGW